MNNEEKKLLKEVKERKDTKGTLGLRIIGWGITTHNDIANNHPHDYKSNKYWFDIGQKELETENKKEYIEIYNEELILLQNIKSYINGKSNHKKALFIQVFDLIRTDTDMRNLILSKNLPTQKIKLKNDAKIITMARHYIEKVMNNIPNFFNNNMKI